MTWCQREIPKMSAFSRVAMARISELLKSHVYSTEVSSGLNHLASVPQGPHPQGKGTPATRVWRVDYLGQSDAGNLETRM